LGWIIFGWEKPGSKTTKNAAFSAFIKEKQAKRRGEYEGNALRQGELKAKHRWQALSEIIATLRIKHIKQPKGVITGFVRTQEGRPFPKVEVSATPRQVPFMAQGRYGASSFKIYNKLQMARASQEKDSDSL